MEGVGAAAVITCGLAAISDTFPAGPERARATGIWGACMGAGPAVGPLLGSAFDVTAGWRWTYVVITLAAGGLAVAGRYKLRESRSGRGRRIDVVGAGLLGVGTGCLLAALTEGRQGWTEPLVIVLAVVAVAGLAGFVLHQRRAADPMLDLSLFRRPALISATLAAFLTGAGIIALMSFMATVLERGMARSSIVASLILLAWSATSVVTSLLARRIPLTVSGGVRLSGGLVLVGVGLVPLAALVVDSSVGQMVVGLIVAGVGTGLLNATLGREAVASVPPAKAGAGSGINNASRYIGAALGVTVVTVIAVHPGADPAHGLVAGWDAAVIVGIVVTVVGAAAVLLLHRADRAFVSRS